MSIDSDHMWSLYLQNGITSSGEVVRSIVWRSTPNSMHPTAKELSQFLHIDRIKEDDLMNLTAQIIRSAPLSAIPNLLSSIACHFWRNESSVIDIRMLESLSNANRRSVCGLVFKKGDVVWTCRTCAKDPTCVQCDRCFKKSDHIDHEVYFHRASGRGGCCDCGDPEAWAPCGNCCDHAVNTNKLDIDPLTALPADLLKGFQAVVMGVVGVIVSYSTATVRGYESYADNIYVKEAKKINMLNGTALKLKVRLHNDDVHTYDEVTRALTALEFSSKVAHTLTVAVDQEGEAIVFVGEISESRLLRASRILDDEAGLLVSITPEKVVSVGPAVAAAFSWLISAGNSNDGLRRIVTEVLMEETNSLPACATSAENSGVSDPSRIFDDLQEIKIFGHAAKVQFPNSIQHLRSRVPDRLTQDPLNKMLRCSPFSVCPHIGLAIILMASPYLSPVLCKAINDLIILYQQDAKFKVVFSQVVTLLYPSLYGLYFRSVGTAKETVFISTVQVYTADSIVTMMSSEGLKQRPLKERRDWQPHTYSKRSFGAVSSADRIAGEDGEREWERAQSNIPGDELISTGMGPEQDPDDSVNLMEVLTSTFLSLLADVGCTVDREDDRFVDHHSIRTRR